MLLKHLTIWGRQWHMQRNSCYNVENANRPPKREGRVLGRLGSGWHKITFCREQALELTREGFGLRGLTEDNKRLLLAGGTWDWGGKFGLRRSWAKRHFRQRSEHKCRLEVHSAWFEKRPWLSRMAKKDWNREVGMVLHTTVCDQRRHADQGVLWNGWVLTTLLISDIPSGFISGAHLLGIL